MVKFYKLAHLSISNFCNYNFLLPLKEPLKEIFFVMIRISLLSLVSLILFSAFNPALSKNEIINSKVSNKYGELRIIFELKKSPKYRVFASKKINQLVIDFQDSNPIKASKLSNFKNDLFKSVKTGFNSHSDLRVTIDMNKKFKIIRSIIINPERNQKNYQLVIILNLNKELSSKEDLDEETEDFVSDKISPLNNKIANQIVSRVDADTGTVTYIIKKKVRLPVIIIDAGHGGHDPGTIGNFARTKEKDITMNYALELKKQLDKTKQFKTFLTRSNDYFLTLGQRVEKARKLDADLFISLHVNSANNKDVTGLSVYTLSENSSDKQAEILAQKENKADIIGGLDFSGTGPDILKTLIDLSQRDSMNNSAKFAQMIIEASQKQKVDILQNTHRFAGFKVLTAPDVASVLIELGYLSNKKEEKLLSKHSHKTKLIKSIALAIENYFNEVKVYN